MLLDDFFKVGWITFDEHALPAHVLFEEQGVGPSLTVQGTTLDKEAANLCTIKTNN